MLNNYYWIILVMEYIFMNELIWNININTIFYKFGQTVTKFDWLKIKPRIHSFWEVETTCIVALNKLAKNSASLLSDHMHQSPRSWYDVLQNLLTCTAVPWQKAVGH